MTRYNAKHEHLTDFSLFDHAFLGLAHMRRALIVFCIGGLLGMGVGLYLGWVQFPVVTVDAGMRALSRAEKDRYTVMVAQSFELDGSPTEAIRRLQPLGEPNIPAYVRDVTERFISDAGSGNQAEIRYLVSLSRALGYFTPPMQAFSAVAPTPIGGR
jgi:hypothetical protein